MKILKTLSIFVIFCVCVCNLTAQIIENVSYTPSKQGNYGTVTTRSLATFAGLVSVGGNQGEVIGVGDKLTLDTYGYNNSTLNAGRNIFTSVTKAPTGNTNVYGNLNTTNNANINTLNAANAIIYGGTTNFANSEVALNNSGILEISDVKMKNPKCDIKWIKLPAYKASADYGHTKTPTATDYWFAYCDSDNTTPGNGAWDISLEDNVSMLGTCTAGWETGTSNEVGPYADTSANDVCHRIGSGGLSTDRSFFHCTASVIKRCSSSPYYSADLVSNNTYIKDCTCGALDVAKNSCPRTMIKVSTGEHIPDWNDKIRCGGWNGRPKAYVLYNQFLPSNSYRALLPMSGTNGTSAIDPCPTKREAFNSKVQRNYCGYDIGTASNAFEAVNSAIRTMRHTYCPGTTLTLKYCSDLYGSAYADNLSNEQICQGIQTAAPTGINVNNFSCIKRGPNRDGYQAMRVARCNDHVYDGVNNTIEICKQLRCDGTRCPADHNSVHYKDYQYRRLKMPYTVYGNVSNLCEWANLPGNTSYKKQPYGSDATVYFEQYISNGQILTCKWED